jgi:D-alanyl-D-alanine carboxypeptidase
MIRALLRAGGLAAVLVLAVAAGAATTAVAATRPPDVSAPSALVVEASTGDVA